MSEIKNKLTRSSITCFADEIADSLDRQIEVLQELGIKWIELRSADGINVSAFTPEYARTVKQKLDAAGIRVSAIGSPIGKINLADDFQPHMEKLTTVERLADIFETPYIRMFSFYLPENRTPENCRDEVLTRMEQMVTEAEKNRLVLLHENEKAIYGDTAPRCLDLMKQFAGEHFRCTFDFANFIECGQDTLEAYHMLQPYIAYVHIKDAVRETKEIVPAGQGDGKLSEIFTLLDRSGYDGFLSLEPHLANFSGLNSLEKDAVVRTENNTEKAFLIAYRALMQLLS